MDNFRASLLMVGSMGLFAVEDALLKRISAELPVGQILAVLGIGGFAVLVLLARVRGVAIGSRAALDPAVMLRNLAEFVGTVGFVTALSLIPISTASVILQAAPLLVTLGAALFYGERVGWRRWTAIAVGFVGVVMVLRPGSEAFDPDVLWAVLGVLGLSIRDLATRRVPRAVATLQLAAWGFLAVGLAGLLLLALGAGAPPAWPSPRAAVELCFAVAVGLVAYAAITAAVRIGEFSIVGPFRYTRLVFAMVLGALFFGERPDAAMLLGAGLIVGAGIYTILREARARRRPAPSPAPAAGL